MPDRWEAIALALAVSSNLFFSIVDALIQHGENLDHIPPAQLTMVRMVCPNSLQPILLPLSLLACN